MDYKALNGICEEYAQKAVEWRRDLHRHPEPAWTEFRTTAFLAKTLEEAGIPVLMGKQVVCPEYAMGYPEESVIKAAMERAVEQGADPSYVQRTQGYTGLCAVIDTGREGPVVAIRMDIDSNDVEENRTDAHRPQKEGFASCNAGAMHACGHDGHAVIGLITALSLYRIREQLQGKVKVIFQPAEEGVRGALSVCKSGILDDVDFVLGGHIAETSDGSLQVCTNTGGYLATDKFDVTFKGEASHAGGSPEKGRNALLAAALATLGMQTQVQDGRGMGRCNVGLLTAGTFAQRRPEAARHHKAKPQHKHRRQQRHNEQIGKQGQEGHPLKDQHRNGQSESLGRQRHRHAFQDLFQQTMLPTQLLPNGLLHWRKEQPDAQYRSKGKLQSHIQHTHGRK